MTAVIVEGGFCEQGWKYILRVLPTPQSPDNMQMMKYFPAQQDGWVKGATISITLGTVVPPVS